jgi:hypothetical protein
MRMSLFCSTFDYVNSPIPARLRAGSLESDTMTATCKITYSAADGHAVPPHYIRVTARDLEAWNAKAARAARAAALRGETVVSITRGDDRPYPDGAPTAYGAGPGLESGTHASRPPIRGLTPTG